MDSLTNTEFLIMYPGLYQVLKKYSFSVEDIVGADQIFKSFSVVRDSQGMGKFLGIRIKVEQQKNLIKQKFNSRKYKVLYKQIAKFRVLSSCVLQQPPGDRLPSQLTVALLFTSMMVSSQYLLRSNVLRESGDGEARSLLCCHRTA